MIKSKILLHACCAPCLTAAHDRLKSEYDIDIVWYNPNIYPVDEEKKRLAELRRYAGEVKANLIELPCNDDDIVEWKQSVVSFAHLRPFPRAQCLHQPTRGLLRSEHRPGRRLGGGGAFLALLEHLGRETSFSPFFSLPFSHTATGATCWSWAR